MKKLPLWHLFIQKQVGKGRERVKIKIFDPSISNLICNRELKKHAKKFKKLENTNMASFQAKTVWERLRKSENENYRSDLFLPDPL